MAGFAILVMFTTLFVPAAEALLDPPLCNGYEITLYLASGEVPTNDSDVIQGTLGDDVVATGAGDDIFCGLGGNDTVWGQGGNDILIGGPGNDRMRGGPGDDTVSGGDGADDLNGGSGQDIVDGGPGDDLVVRGGTGDDLVSGGGGNDTLVSGNGGSDTVDGGPGADKVVGGPRPDRVFGGAGDDEVKGNKGADLVLGGSGIDAVFGGPQADLVHGGPDNDACNGNTTGTNNAGGIAIENDLAGSCEQVSNTEGCIVSIAADAGRCADFAAPLRGPITNGFGIRYHPVSGAPTLHAGIDFSAATGAPIFSSAAGTVVVAENEGDGYGNKVVVDHGNGLSTLYAHLDSIAVTTEQQLGTGALLGGVGSTGHSTGPHLHFEMHYLDVAFDPELVIAFEPAISTNG